MKPFIQKNKKIRKIREESLSLNQDFRILLETELRRLLDVDFDWSCWVVDFPRMPCKQIEMAGSKRSSIWRRKFQSNSS